MDVKKPIRHEPVRNFPCKAHNRLKTLGAVPSDIHDHGVKRLLPEFVSLKFVEQISMVVLTLSQSELGPVGTKSTVSEVS